MDVLNQKITRDEAIAVLSGESVPLELAINMSQIICGTTILESQNTSERFRGPSESMFHGFKAAFLKLHGNKALNEKKMFRAIELYTLAIAAVRERDSFHPEDGGNFSPLLHVLFSNRSLAHMGTVNAAGGEALEKARSDAAACVNLEPKFGKGYHRLASSLKALGRIDEARAVLRMGVEKAALPADRKALGDFLKELGPDEEEEKMLAEAVRLSLGPKASDKTPKIGRAHV